MKEETYNEQIVIIPPEGYKTCKYRDEKGVLHFEFQKFEEQKERKLPKSWEEFCEMFPVKQGEYHIMEDATLFPFKLGQSFDRHKTKDITTLPDHATAEAVLALCQLIQLRNCYNGDWVPDWFDYHQTKYVINFVEKDIVMGDRTTCGNILYFKTRELRDDFLRYFRPLIEKLKPLHGIK